MSVVPSPAGTQHKASHTWPLLMPTPCVKQCSSTALFEVLHIERETPYRSAAERALELPRRESSLVQGNRIVCLRICSPARSAIGRLEILCRSFPECRLLCIWLHAHYTNYYVAQASRFMDDSSHPEKGVAPSDPCSSCGA